jgi:hypothetical protein
MVGRTPWSARPLRTLFSRRITTLYKPARGPAADRASAPPCVRAPGIGKLDGIDLKEGVAAQRQYAPGPRPTPRSAFFLARIPGRVANYSDMTLYLWRLPHDYETEQPVFLTWRLYDSLPPHRPFPPAALTSGQAFDAMDRLLEPSPQWGILSSRTAGVRENPELHRRESRAGGAGERSQ